MSFTHGEIIGEIYEHFVALFVFSYMFSRQLKESRFYQHDNDHVVVVIVEVNNFDNHDYSSHN